ncbi:MAG TPA: AbrB family transcriptional regulator [Alphaproteobacteria bacterium]|nr:AbrB family transcriptional regulator [Alphaproteobacteria bacterium]
MARFLRLDPAKLKRAHLKRAFAERGWKWAALTALSLALATALEYAAFPAALLLGPMVAAIGFGVGGARLELPRLGFVGAQSIVGCLIASSVSLSIVATVAHDWAIMLLVVATTVVAAGVVGWVLVRFGSLPGTTAAWGSSPGGASAMIVMAEAYGADIRLVAFMQYLRVIIVVLTASLVSHLLLGAAGATAFATVPNSFAAIFEAPPLALAETLAIAGVGATLGRVLRVPAGGLLVPMAIGAALHIAGLVELALPTWLLGVAYAAIGWYIGLGFNRAVIRYAFRAIPQLVLGTAMLIGLCAFSAWLLTWLLGTEPLTAYLATAPGGLDSVAIIAIGSHADIPFVMALQTLRVFTVIALGPSIAKAISKLA